MIASLSDTVAKCKNKVFGYVKDIEGRPVSGVAISDGFTVTYTDEKGRYTIQDVSPDCYYIYYSTPEEYEAGVNGYGQPCFWKQYVPGEKRYDFTLKPMLHGKEEEFALFAFGDPQVHSKGNLKRFLDEAVPGIRKHARSLGVPLYGMTLGDVVFNTDNFKCTHMMDDMRDGFAVGNIGMPVYQILGNHDHNEFNALNPLGADSRSSDTNLKAQRDFETVFGPVDYSFNRSDAHIIGMRNVIFSSATTSSTGNYHGGFTDRQYEWLKQDLALVPKDKLIIFCVHIPLYRCEDKNIPSLNTDTNVSNVMNLLSRFENVHVLSGHTHTQRNYQHPNGIWEHTIASVAGAWWRCCVCGDGTPNGFCVFNIRGNQIKDFYFHGYTAASSTRSHQMRLYRGNAVTGGAITGENKNGTAGYYGFNMSEDVILANVYNASSEWKISVYEDGVYSGDMTLLPSEQPDIKDLIGDYTYENPRRAPEGVSTGHDFWVTGYLMGVQGKKKINGGYQNCFHMYHYKLKNKDSEIKVIATDTWGNIYEETVITDGMDYTTAVKP